MFKSMLMQLCLLSFALLTFSSHPGSKVANRKELRKEQSFGWFSDSISWIPWLIRNIISVIYFTISTVMQALMHVMATVFGLLHQFIKLIEFVGYCVRLVLQANYNVVSSCIMKIRCVVENSYVLFRDLIISTGKTFISLVKTILHFLHSLVFNMPKLYELTGTGLQKSVRMAVTVSHKTNSTFRTFVNMVKAVVELFGRSILNTSKLIVDLLYNVLLSCGHFFQFIGKNIISLAVKAGKNLVLFLEKVWTGIEICGSIIISYTKALFNGGVGFLRAVVFTCYDIILSVLQSIGLLVRHCGRFILNRFIGLGRAINNTARSITDIGAQLISSINASKLSVVSLSSMVLVLTSLWVAFKINVFILVFGFLESSIQYVTLLMIGATDQEQTAVNREKRKSNTINSTTADSAKESEESLRRQLELERDKTLCVVCRDQIKKILLLPCRHMCICVMCANHITSFVHWNRRVCPLCRTRIGSMVEVYS